MSSSASSRKSGLLASAAVSLILAACGQGDGPQSIPNTPATPLPPIPPGFCDAINFEILCDAVNIINFNGGATTVIDNPDQSGINLSDRVAQMQKFPDQPFGGTLLDTGAPIDFSAGEAFTVKVWSPRSVPLTFKLDQQNKERVRSHSGSGTWEELCFDFTGDTAGAPNPGLTLIFDDGTLGQADTDPANWTFYYDDILQVASCGGPALPSTFSTLTFDDATFTVTLSGFGGAEDSALAADPDDATNQVVRINRSDTAEVFAGTTISLGPNESVPDIPLDAMNTEMNLRVRAPAAGIPIRLKIENAADGNIAVETEAITTGNTWETLTFDFSVQAMGTTAFDPAATYNKITVFPNFGTGGATAGAQTYYVDDIAVGAGSGGGGGGSGGAGPGLIPEQVIFATDPSEMVDLPPPVIENFGSGAVFDFTFAGDPDFNPALQVTSGEGYGAGVHSGFIALDGYAPGFAAGYQNLLFKVKGDAANLDEFEVKFIGGGTDTSVTYDITSYAGSTDLGAGWYQVTVPLSDFSATIAANTGFLIGPLGGQPAAFTYLLTDIGFSGTAGGSGGGAAPGITPDNVVFATDPGVTEDLAPPAVDNFGSGAVFDFMFTGDADFNPAIQVTSGEGYGAGVHVGFVAFNGYADGFAAGFENFVFKIKADAANLGVFEVKFINNGDTGVNYDLTTYSGVTDLGNGWLQVTIPMSDFAATSAVNSGFLLGPFGGQPAAYTYLMTDIGFTGTAGGGGGSSGITPDNVVFATDPGVTEDLAPPAVDNFGSGAAFDFMFAGDADFSPAIQVTSGEGYGAGVHVGFVAFNGYADGFAAGFENFVFKIKADAANLGVFEVKFINNGDTGVNYDLTTYSGVTDLGNGWLQVSIPMSDFAATSAVNSGFLLGPFGGQPAAFTYLMTDIGFTGTASGGGGGGSSGPGEQAVNGDIEAGDLSGFEIFPNGGTITADNTQNNTTGGTWSIRAVAGPGNNPVIKQERRGIGVVTGGQTVTISFDMQGSAADGGVIFPELISEGAGGATVSNILETITAPTAGWTTYSYTPAVAADVTEGITFQIAVVCGGAPTCSADVFIDNVSVVVN